jgi:uncharacterized protein (DUF736 family)
LVDEPIRKLFAKIFVVVASVIVALVADKPTTFKIFAHKVASTFRLVILEVEIVVVPKVEVPADNIPAFVFAEVKLVVEIFVKVAFPLFIVALAIVVVASVVVAETKFETLMLVEVALVIVALSAVNPSTLSMFAHKVANTFKLVIVEVEIVVVPKVEVPADNIPAFVFAEIKLVVEIFVDVEFVIVASEKFAVPLFINALAIVAVASVVVPVFAKVPVVVE